MTPKEKANKLCMRFLIQTTTDIPYGINKAIAKECALIAVDEILESNPTKINCDSSELNYGYYIQVKKEIELL
jgi:archaellum component FlaG (FlaF/FlaG flagellin family)